MSRAHPFHINRAKKAYTAFTGHEADVARISALDDAPVASYRLGDLVGIAYEATRDGETDQYFHKFGKKARPELLVKHDGSQLYIDGGEYEVTDHGIEDMPELFVVNPSARRKRRAKSPAKKRKSVFMANPAKRRRRRRAVTRRASTARSYRRNPAPRVTRRRRRRSVGSVAVARRRGYRRNPISGGRGKGGFKIIPLLMPALMIGAGAVGAELVMGYLPIPAQLKVGPMRYATKAAVSVGVGYLIAKFANKKAGEAFAMGGIAIAAHDAIKSLVVGVMPGAQFGGWDGDFNSELGYYSPALTDNSMGEYMGEYNPSAMGEFVAEYDSEDTGDGIGGTDFTA